MAYLTDEQVNQYLNDIDNYFEQGNMTEIFNTSKKLFDGTDGRKSYFLGCCYMNEWGTDYDLEKSIYYLNYAVKHRDCYEYATYLLGIAYYRKSDYENAVPWFSASYEAGNKGAAAFMADSAAAIALNTWDMVRRCVLQDEISQGVDVVKKFIAIAQRGYVTAANEAPDSMTSMFWCGLGRINLLLYNLSTLGYLDLNIVTDNSFMTLLTEGAGMAAAKMDTDAHYKVFRQGIAACDFMASKGAVLVAEYFRAYLALLECERHKSAEALFRAMWHMRRIGELRGSCADAADIAAALKDMDEKYAMLDRKYGSMVRSMISQGKRPFIAESYGEGLAPSVESCANFMKVYQMPAGGSSPKPEKKGFFAKLFRK